MPGAAVGQPAGHREPEAAEAAGQDVGGVRPNRRSGKGRRRNLDLFAGEVDRDLAEVAGLAHGPERRVHFACGHLGDRQRGDGAPLVEVGHLPHARADVFGLQRHHLVVVERVERHGLLRRGQPHGVVGDASGLAQLHEPSERAQ